MNEPAPALRSRPLPLLLRLHAVQSWRRILALREQSRLLTSVIGLFIVGYLGLSFGLFYWGLRFVSRVIGLGPVLTEHLLYLLFACLFALLLLSNLVICYTNFFRNRETAFLLTQPISRATVFQWKFIESTLLASWAFLFLIAPLLIAFGLTRQAPWHFYLATPVLVTLFIILPGALGAWLAIYVGRYLDRRSFQIALVTGSLALLAWMAFWWKTRPVTNELLESRVVELLDQLLVRTRFAESAFLPSHWLATSVLQWAEGGISGAMFFALVLLSNAAFFGWIALVGCGNLFYDTASAVQSRASGGEKKSEASGRSLAGKAGWLERGLQWLPWIGSDARALVVKDIRVFWRDTTQWGQSVMLFGLLAVYIINLRHFTHHISSPFWINLVAYLNLGACALNLATLTTRFVYPQFSLEGRRLWIIGMAPLGLPRVVKAKYWLASVAALTVTLTLIVLSCYLLRMGWARIAFFAAVITVMTFALSGLSVGLGVLYPNFKETTPSKIVSGFGGTLCLVLSFFYILASVLLLGFGAGGLHGHAGFLAGSILVFAVLSWLVGWMPLRLALRRLDQLEV